MKKSLMACFGVLLMINLSIFVSASSLSDFCSSNNYECGVWDNNPEIYRGDTTNCGTCTDGVCIVGKCYTKQLAGKCVSLPYGTSSFQTESGII